VSALDKPESTSPAALHAEGLGRFTALAAERERKSKRISTARLVVFLGTLATGVLCYDLGLPYAITLAPLAGFIALVVVHERVERARKDAQARARFHQASVRRLEGTWMGTGAGGARFHDEEHPYARDLDLFGEGSLFELLCRAETPWGEAELAAWLRGAAGADEIEARQSAVRALADDVAFREELAAAGARTRRDLDDQPRGFADAEGLAAWAGGRADFPVPLVAVFFLVVAANVTLSILWAVGDVPWYAPLGSVLLSVILSRPFARHTRAALDGALSAESALGPLAEVLTVTGAAPAGGQDLSGAAPAVRKLAAYAHRASSMRNPFFYPFGLALGWSEWSALLVERWRRAHGGEVSRWLEAIGRLEALSSLAAFAYEQSAVFPEVTDGDARFVAEGLGHPLLTSPVGGVRNDVSLDKTRLMVISGSNMSGKSTLLRAIGSAVVLALAGGPVLARACALSRVEVAASIALHDSIKSGESRFYAELLRLKQIVDLAHQGPALYLLDELLSGTNSHDRQIGAEALMKRLVESGAVGLVTTHDLALTDIEELGERARNVHFQDELKGGQLVFDYTLKDGVVTRSNARDLMREVGLLS
jgi:ABC-type transport system involved in cytochrome c biogenesis ATPase subunit